MQSQAKAKAKAALALPSKASPSKGSPSKPKPKASPKATAKASNRKPKSSAKASKPEKPRKDAPAGEVAEVKKREWLSDEDKSFARRAKPKSMSSLNHWTAIRDVFNSELASKYNACSHQDSQAHMVYMHLFVHPVFSLVLLNRTRSGCWPSHGW